MAPFGVPRGRISVSLGLRRAKWTGHAGEGIHVPLPILSQRGMPWSRYWGRQPGMADMAMFSS